MILPDKTATYIGDANGGTPPYTYCWYLKPNTFPDIGAVCVSTSYEMTLKSITAQKKSGPKTPVNPIDYTLYLVAGDVNGYCGTEGTVIIST